MMPQASADYTERIESPQPLSSLIQNVWELTDQNTQTVLSNESRDSKDKSDDNVSPPDKNKSGETKKNSFGNTSSHGDTILSGGPIMSFIGSLGGLDGLKKQGLDMSMDKEARHLRKYLYQNRKRFDNLIEELTMFNADNLKNWAIFGNLMTIMISDVILIFLSTQESLQISRGLVEALMIYNNFFSNSYRTIELNEGKVSIFDDHQKII